MAEDGPVIRVSRHADRVARALLEAGTVTLSTRGPGHLQVRPALAGLRGQPPAHLAARAVARRHRGLRGRAAADAAWSAARAPMATVSSPGWRAPASRTAARWPSPPGGPRCSCARRPRTTAWAAASRAVRSAGRRVVLVEDMVTTGGSSLSAVDALREAGASVSRVPRHHHLRVRRGHRGLPDGRCAALRAHHVRGRGARGAGRRPHRAGRGGPSGWLRSLAGRRPRMRP